MAYNTLFEYGDRVELLENIRDTRGERQVAGTKCTVLTVLQENCETDVELRFGSCCNSSYAWVKPRQIRRAN